MNRRSFLQFLGLAPIAPAVIAAIPEQPVYLSEMAYRAGISTPLPYGRAPMVDALPLYREWNTGMTDDLLREIEYQFPDEPDRIPPALRA